MSQRLSRINPWANEPDLLSLESNGYHLLIIRHPDLLHLNGYVGVQNNHPLYEKEWDDVDVNGLSVHGEITYIGNSPLGTKEGFWYFGFDTAHYGDYVPNLMPLILDGTDDTSVQEELLNKMSEIADYFSQVLGGEKQSDKGFFMNGLMGDRSQYKDIVYVASEVNDLLTQLISIKNKTIDISSLRVNSRIENLHDDET